VPARRPESPTAGGGGAGLTRACPARSWSSGGAETAMARTWPSGTRGDELDELGIGTAGRPRRHDDEAVPTVEGNRWWSGR
jgi:hypothetical protein